jgi:DNA polymerase III epsilon subunit-like protein
MDRMVLIDLETQSFEVESGIYEVACLVVKNYEIIDQLYLGEEIKGYNEERRYGYGFHDISTNVQYIEKFKAFMNKYPYPIVAHNCPFDRKFLQYYGWISEDYPAYCSMRAIRMKDNSLTSYSLQNLVKHFSIAEDVNHDAMSDIKNVYNLLKLLKPDVWYPVGTSSRKIFRHISPKARKLEDIDLNISTTQILAGETVCFTGLSQYPRNIMQEIAIKNGANISNTITLKTTMLIVGLNAGSKLDKAQEKDISIIADDDFMQLLNFKNKNIEFPKIS